MKKFIYRLFLVFFTFFISSPFIEAQTCNKNGLREDFNKELEKKAIIYTSKNDQLLGPVRDQGSTSYCFANAEADLYEHWLKKNGFMDKKEQVSAVSMAIMAQKNRWRDLLTEIPSQSFMDQDKIKKIEEINRLVFSQVRFKESEIKDISEQNKMTIEERKTYLKKIEDYNKGINALWNERKLLINNFSQMTPYGGYSASAIKKGMQRLCFESEVSSSGIDRKNEGNKNNLESIAFRPWDGFQNIGDALLYLNVETIVETSASEEKNCQYLQVANIVFPGLMFENVKELKTFLEKLGESHVDQLLQASCSEKKIPKKPIIKHESEFSNIFLKNENKKLATIIDGALKKGDIASVGYNMNILVSEKISGPYFPNHFSVITGSMDICGSAYYVLRNSFGKNGCKNKLLEFESELSAKSDYKLALGKKNECSQKAEDLFKAMNNQCRNEDVLCTNKNSEQFSNSKDLCRLDFEQATQNLPPFPLYCNAEGDFIIRKDHFLKGAVDVLTIEN